MEDSMDLGLGLLFGGVGLFIGLAIYIIYGFSLGKLFQKAGKPLWAGFIPIYNIYVVLEVIGRPTWWIALFLVAVIPFIGSLAVFLLSIIIWIEFAKSYGKDTLWGVLISFFGIIMLPMMAFNDETQYLGPVGNNDPNPFSAFSSGGGNQPGGTGGM